MQTTENSTVQVLSPVFKINSPFIGSVLLIIHLADDIRNPKGDGFPPGCWPEVGIQ
jgi:hypothetical protein